MRFHLLSFKEGVRLKETRQNIKEGVFMFVLRIWNYLRGYAIIIVEGLKIERFINLSVINNIYIWDIKRLSYTSVEAKIGLGHFAKLREIVKKTNSTVKIERKSGLPFMVKKLKKQKLMIFGFTMVLVFLFIITSYVWMIEVTGTKTIDKAVILKNLYEEGLREGQLKRKIDNRFIENKLLIKMPELSWVGVQIKGTKAIVEVVEKRPEPEIVKRDEACNIISAKDGVISKINVLYGDGKAKSGDTVKKGQILVAGEIIRENSPVRYVHSMAQVTGRTWYEDVEEMLLEQTIYKKTGKSKSHYQLVVIGKSMLKEKEAPFKEYNKYIEEKNVMSFGNYIFPIKIIKTIYIELQSENKKYTVEEAKERCAERLKGRIKLQIPESSVVVDSKIDYYVEKKMIKSKISVEVMEEIGVQQKINN